MAKFCSYCGKPVSAKASFCANCGAKIAGEETDSKDTQEYSYHGTGANGGAEAKSRVAAGLLGIFFGGFGIHNFYLGYTNRGVAQIIVSFCTCGIGSIWGFVEGLMILCGSINEDSDGVALKD